MFGYRRVKREIDNYSIRFKSGMLNEEYYIVRLSLLNKDFLKQDYNIVPDDVLVLENKINLGNKKDITGFYDESGEKLKSDFLIVKTGESCGYVREFLTDVEIPVIYTRLNGEVSSIDGINLCNLNCQFSSVSESDKLSLPYFIMANEMKLVVKDSGRKYNINSLGNFDEMRCLTKYDEELMYKILGDYFKMHNDIKVYKGKLETKFKEYQEKLDLMLKENELNTGIKKRLEIDNQ
jgi:hypothetical protein